MNDATTFLLAFLSVFAGIAYYLVWLERKAKVLEARLRTLAASSTAAKANNPDPPAEPKA